MKLIHLLKAAACNMVLILFVSTCGGADNLRETSPHFAGNGRQTLTLVSFNIRVGYGTKDWGMSPFELRHRKKTIAPIIGAIRSCEADIVGLQEVLGRDQARKLAEALGMKYAYAAHPTTSPYGPWWGVALLSKYRIVDAENFPISVGRGDSKTALRCSIDVRGRIIHVINVHKDRDLKDGNSFRKIMKQIKPLKGAVALIGDMNMLPADSRFNILNKRFKDSAETINSDRARQARDLGTFLGVGRIDYVLIDPTYLKVLDVGLANRRFWGASDHLAFWAKVIFQTR